MELWIRSQDKEKLVKCNDIAIKSFLYNEIPEDEWCHSIVGCFDKETEYEILGSYKTKERTIEVLDEIQSKLASNKIVMQLDRNTRVGEETVDMFNDKYNIKLLPAGATLKSVLNDIVIYKMPEE